MILLRLYTPMGRIKWYTNMLNENALSRMEKKKIVYRRQMIMVLYHFLNSYASRRFIVSSVFSRVLCFFATNSETGPTSVINKKLRVLRI